jgi:flagellar biosynthesis GTPase FlhF
MGIAEKLKNAKNKLENVSARPKPQVFIPEDDEDLTMLLFGHTGSGKTYFIVGLL